MQAFGTLQTPALFHAGEKTGVIPRLAWLLAQTPAEFSLMLKNKVFRAADG
jgi:hypothetical protein